MSERDPLWVAHAGAGQNPAILTDRALAVFFGGGAEETARRILHSGAIERGWIATADELVRPGFAELPAAVVAGLVPSEVAGEYDIRGIVRGPLRVQLRGNEGDVVLDGADALTWREFRVRAGAVLRVTEASEPDSLTEPAARDLVTVAPGPLSISQIRVDTQQPAAEPPSWSAIAAPRSAPVDAAQTLTLGDSISTAQAPAEAVRRAKEPAHDRPQTLPVPEASSLDASRFEELFGQTIHGSVEAAAVRALEPETESDNSVLPEEDSAGVTGVMCPAGHANPLERAECAVCGEPLRGGRVGRVPRPSVGSLLLPDGREIALSGEILLGRSPRSDRVSGERIPQLIVLDHRDVSRTHVRLSIEGWRVLAEDLGSTNGTVLRTADGRTHRVRTGQPVIVPDGAVLELGGGPTLSFQGVP